MTEIIDDIKQEEVVEKATCKRCGKDPGEDGLCKNCSSCGECCQCGEV